MKAKAESCRLTVMGSIMTIIAVPDVFTPAKRSEVMSRIRSRGNYSTEGRVVVFVDGCFWHGCPRHATRPKQNRTFWDAKIAGNKARDARVHRGLRKAGWKVLRIWECELTVKRQPATLNRLRRALALGMECG